jgi:hypothetical protein
MDYSIFCGILNKQIFDRSKRDLPEGDLLKCDLLNCDLSKGDLIEKISNYPGRYAGGIIA